MESVAIVGVGLIGASFGLALREAGFTGEITGVSSPAAVAAGIKRGAISRGVTLAEAAARADLIYLAQRVDRILETIELLPTSLRSGCLVTDAGSTKGSIVARAGEHLPEGAFLGGHPLAGKEQRGAEAADAGLFRGRRYVLTPSLGPYPPCAVEFRGWLVRIGATVLDMSPDEHDAAVAFTSHLPQLLSTALAETLATCGDANLEKVFGPGLLDMTRLALSAPDLWLSILASNRKHVLSALDLFLLQAKKLRETIGKSELAYSFDTAAEFSIKIRKLDD